MSPQQELFHGSQDPCDKAHYQACRSVTRRPEIMQGQLPLLQGRISKGMGAQAGSLVRFLRHVDAYFFHLSLTIGPSLASFCKSDCVDKRVIVYSKLQSLV
jgi:hypothetical protein